MKFEMTDEEFNELVKKFPELKQFSIENRFFSLVDSLERHKLTRLIGQEFLIPRTKVVGLYAGEHDGMFFFVEKNHHNNFLSWEQANEYYNNTFLLPSVDDLLQMRSAMNIFNNNCLPEERWLYGIYWAFDITQDGKNAFGLAFHKRQLVESPETIQFHTRGLCKVIQ